MKAIQYKGAVYVEARSAITLCIKAGLNQCAKKLAQEHGGKILRYDQLPVPSQLAIAFLMLDHGTEWATTCGLDPDNIPSNLKKKLSSLLPKLRKVYGKEKFGYVEVPMGAMTSAIMECDPQLRKDFQNFERYHRWYLKQGLPSHSKKSPWPVFLEDSGGFSELLQDGWHRLHKYYELGMKKVPCIWYP